MSNYTYTIDSASQFSVFIEGPFFRCIYPRNTITNKSFETYEEAEIFAKDEIFRLENPMFKQVHYFFEMSGGDGKTPPGIKNDGIDKLTIKITARTTDAPDSDIIKYTDSLRINISNEETGLTHDVVNLEIVDGTGTINYTSLNPTGLRCNFYVKEDSFFDLDKTNSKYSDDKYRVFLHGDTEFVIYRDL